MSNHNFNDAIMNYIFLSIYQYGKSCCLKNNLKYNKFHINFLQANGVNKPFSKCIGFSRNKKKCFNSRKYGSYFCYKHEGKVNHTICNNDIELFEILHNKNISSETINSNLPKSLFDLINKLVLIKKNELNQKIKQKFKTVSLNLKNFNITKKELIYHYTSINEKQKLKEYISSHHCAAETKLSKQCKNKKINGSNYCRIHIKDISVKDYKIKIIKEKKPSIVSIKSENFMLLKPFENEKVKGDNKKYLYLKDSNKLKLLI